MIGPARHTKAAHPPAMAQPIVWVVQLTPSSSKNEDCSTATVFSAGHSGRGMREDWAKGCGLFGRGRSSERRIRQNSCRVMGTGCLGRVSRAERAGECSTFQRPGGGRTRCRRRYVAAVVIWLATGSKAKRIFRRTSRILFVAKAQGFTYIHCRCSTVPRLMG